VGFALGLTLALWHLIVMTRPKVGEKSPRAGSKKQ